MPDESRATNGETITQILDPSQLRADSKLLQEIRSMVNESFAKHVSAYFPASSKRLETDEAFADELMEDGFAVLVYAPWPEHHSRNQGMASKLGQLVATACVRSGEYADFVMKGKSVSAALESEGETSHAPGTSKATGWSKTREWELKFAVVRHGTTYQKRGYAAIGMEVLEKELIRRVGEVESARNVQLDVNGTIRLLACAHKELNGGYWERRGYQTYKTLPCPKGTWGSLRDFTVIYMEKELPISNLTA